MSIKHTEIEHTRTGRTLSREHHRILEVASAIDRDVSAERGYYTARRGADVPACFKDWQRKPGLVVPMFSPDGETTGWQLRPDKPRKKKNGEPLKYETPAGISPVVDVHPRMVEEARNGSGPLVITEGAKTGDAMTSHGVCTVVLAGVWMWCVPRVKPYRLKACFDHIRLEGREVLVAFDSDCMTKAGVQEALEALVQVLERRRALVRVVYLPDAPGGSKQGLDDFLAGGGTVREVFALARRFDPADVGRIRLSRDEKLRGAVEDLEQRWWAEEWKGRGGHSERDVALELIRAAARFGKVHPDGLRVAVSWGVLQVRSKVSRKTLAGALGRLEARGFCYRDNEGRKAERAGAFVLRAKVDHNEGASRKEPAKEERDNPGGLPLRVPRLRFSRPKWTSRRGTVRGTRKIREGKPPAPRERVERLGKIRGAVVDALEVAGGSLTLAELCEILRRKRARDVRRRLLPMLEAAGIISVEGDAVSLTADWRERLEAAREAGGELEADELAESRRKRNSRAYRLRNAAPKSAPSPAGLAAVKRSHEARAAGISAERVRAAKAERGAEVRRAAAFVRGRFAFMVRIRLALLRDVWRDEGGDPRSVMPAVELLGCRVEELPEYGGERFVFPPASEGAA
jgi:uncharacterized protein DUF3854